MRRVDSDQFEAYSVLTSSFSPLGQLKFTLHMWGSIIAEDPERSFVQKSLLVAVVPL